MRLLTLFACAALLSACATRPPQALNLVPESAVLACNGGKADTAEVTYLGVGGFLIRFREDAILTAPHFTTPSMSEVAQLLGVRSDTARANMLMQARIPEQAVRDSIRGILVGHSHYDHLMDVPHVARRHARVARIYGNDAMLNLLHFDSASLFHRLVSVEKTAGTWRRDGEWHYPHRDSTVRFMALRSGHAPHMLGVKGLYRRKRERRPTPPPTAWTWAEGQTLSFVIDFLQEKRGEPLVRIHYQDSASDFPLGAPPPLPPLDKGYDVALVTLGSFAQVKAYPQEIIRELQPRAVVVGHWEDFFRPPTLAPKVVRGSNAVEFAHRVKSVLPEGSQYATPYPGARLRVCVPSRK